MFSVVDSGNVLTNRRVIRYGQGADGTRAIYEIVLDDVASVEELVPGGFASDSVYQVNSIDPEAWVQLELSAENGGDRKFVDSLRRKIQR